jgi:nitrogen regulatory protein P-II 1
MIKNNDRTTMKEIKAIIQPAMLSRVIGALKAMADLPGVTVSEVRGFGKSRAADATEKVVEDAVEYSTKVKLEIVVPENRVEDVLATIRAHAHTGHPGDGKIFVTTVDDVVKIRTGQRGEQAI